MLPAAYEPVPKVRANLVQGPGGVFADGNGSSRGISNQLDLARLLELRRQADVLVTGGVTARREHYRVPRSCDLAVFSRAGFQPAASDSTYRFIDLRMDVLHALAELSSRGYEHILLECGPSSLRSVIASRQLDQLCLTNTGGSEPDLTTLGIAAATLLYSELVEDTTFTVWGQIQPN